MFFAPQLTDRVLAPNLTFSERTMVLWRCSKKRKKERVSEREIRGRKLVASVGMRGEEGWDGKATHNLEFTANVLRPIWAKFVSDPALNYKIPTSLCLSPLLLHPTPFLPPLPILFFFFFFFFTPLFFYLPLVFVFLSVLPPALLFVLFIFSFCLFITVRMGFVSYHEAVKTRASPRGLAVREQSKERGEARCLLFLIEFFILIHEIYIAEARAKAADHRGTL